MILDYVARTGFFKLMVPRNNQKLCSSISEEHGWDWGEAQSTPTIKCFHTKVEYAAAAFDGYATPSAQAQLAPILSAISKSWANDSSANIRVPADKELWPFQRASVAYALERQHTLIADQPGLGKTPQAIAFANEVRAERVLVICPASIRLQWAKRIWEWSTMWPRPHVHVILNGRRGVHPTAPWTVCSYDLTRSEPLARALTQERYDLLILDEAHFAKSGDAGRTRALFGGGLNPPDYPPLAACAERILALTGTPLPNRPREAYVLARNLNWDSIDWMSEDRFKERFNPSTRIEGVNKKTGKSYFYIDERTGRHAELQNRLRTHFMVRHLKKDVLTQLPEVVHDIVYMEETGAVKAALKAESMLDIDVEDFDGLHADIDGNLARVRHMMGVAIAPLAADYAEMILGGGEEKLALFVHHRAVADILIEKLHGYGAVRIDGQCSATQKQALVDAFIEQPDIRVCVGNLQSMGVGTDGLQLVCRHCLFVESSWVFGENQQGIDRFHRGGQLNGVLAEFLVAKGSLSEKILGKSLQKGSTIHAALDKKVSFNVNSLDSLVNKSL